MEKKYIFFDIDGTLISHTIRDYISESTILALKKLKENGHFISLATGRAVYLTKEIAKKTGVKSLVCEGGHGIIVDGELKSYEPIDMNIAINILKRCDELGLAWAVSISDNEELVTKNERMNQIISNAKFMRKILVKPDYDYSNETCIRRIIIENNEELYNQIEEIKKIGFMHYAGSLFAFIEPDDKYRGIKKLVEMQGGHEDDIIVFGDGINDLKMFENAKTSVAMGNAIDALKEIATHITEDSDSDGIYNACVRLGLID
ncbi:Cof-type HAD-IIB family hydrolase [Anaerorhabdus furcosa]|uniref:Cof subfamily of IIB subfamily of haloacid dehalogenase superfamily/HAD-superfamily hydrolase, subfamily IIB n=1 Tax=Anaerorhabdus furcosa TaxID=118967 RepID=A0A1T4MU97_9FIRM|nr:HAD family hydrolase [Anaerorhabdus furcosa]SJZ70345.1 hypothetical protein SAMN02745191_1408 [Anaerorhabdus furcosa]